MICSMPAMHSPHTNVSGDGSVVPLGPIGVLVLAEYRRAARLRGAGRLAFGRFRLRGTPGLRFARVMGSGAGGKFGLRPSLDHQGMFLSFDDSAAARHFLATSRFVAAIRDDARQFLSLTLRAYSSRGRWAGVEPFPVVVPRPTSGPIAGLTRASIRPSKAIEFWRHAPPAQAALSSAEGCRIAVGLGEAPIFRQATFTLWDSEAAMDRYARSGAHLDAIRAARAGRHFSEDMFTRFVPGDIEAGSVSGHRSRAAKSR
jgi:hypothetical protein